MSDGEARPLDREKPAIHDNTHDFDSGVGQVTTADPGRKHSIISKIGEVVNASGHRDQLQRQYGTLSICG